MDSSTDRKKIDFTITEFLDNARISLDNNDKTKNNTKSLWMYILHGIVENQ